MQGSASVSFEKRLLLHMFVLFVAVLVFDNLLGVVIYPVPSRAVSFLPSLVLV